MVLGHVNNKTHQDLGFILIIFKQIPRGAQDGAIILSLSMSQALSAPTDINVPLNKFPSPRLQNPNQSLPNHEIVFKKIPQYIFFK